MAEAETGAEVEEFVEDEQVEDEDVPLAREYKENKTKSPSDWFSPKSWNLICSTSFGTQGGLGISAGPTAVAGENGKDAATEAARV